MGAVRPAVRRAADVMLRSSRVRRVVLRSAARRQRAIVLLWHRIDPFGPSPNEVVPTVPLDRFRAQLDLLQELGSVVALGACDDRHVADAPETTPRFALTFDDDDARHTRYVLPALLERGLPATFFLSGRWLHGHGPYWWELLEREIEDEGTAAVARRHGLAADLSAPRLGQALTGTRAADTLAQRAHREGRPPMDGGDATSLAAAGMDIGFHTIDHDALPLLDDDALPDVVRGGRTRLEDALGVPVERFAYPHGLVNARAADAVRDAGYRSAWTTTKRVARPGDDPMLRGRWDVGHRPLDEIRSTLLRGLARPSP